MIESMLKEKFETFNALSDLKKNKLAHVNCCEHMVISGHEVYGYPLSETMIKMAKGFGGGMKIGTTCGALTGGVMVLGLLFEDHEKFDEIVEAFLVDFKRSYKTLDCQPLKTAYRQEDKGWQPVIIMAARVLDSVISKYRKQV